MKVVNECCFHCVPCTPTCTLTYEFNYASNTFCPVNTKILLWKDANVISYKLQKSRHFFLSFKQWDRQLLFYIIGILCIFLINIQICAWNHLAHKSCCPAIVSSPSVSISPESITQSTAAIWVTPGFNRQPCDYMQQFFTLVGNFLPASTAISAALSGLICLIQVSGTIPDLQPTVVVEISCHAATSLNNDSLNVSRMKITCM